MDQLRFLASEEGLYVNEPLTSKKPCQRPRDEINQPVFK